MYKNVRLLRRGTAQVFRIMWRVMIFGGAAGDRTPDLLIANQALSQLSYSPVKAGQKIKHFMAIVNWIFERRFFSPPWA